MVTSQQKKPEHSRIVGCGSLVNKNECIYETIKRNESSHTHKKWKCKTIRKTGTMMMTMTTTRDQFKRLVRQCKHNKNGEFILKNRDKSPYIYRQQSENILNFIYSIAKRQGVNSNVIRILHTNERRIATS